MLEWSAAELLIMATVCAVMGMTSLALAMEVHWQQVQTASRVHHPWRWRVAGAIWLMASLYLCLQADRPSMAVLVWLMLLTLAAVLTAQVLAWRPRWLLWLARMA